MAKVASEDKVSVVQVTSACNEQKLRRNKRYLSTRSVVINIYTFSRHLVDQQLFLRNFRF